MSRLLHLLGTEHLKHRRSILWWIVLGGPLLTAAMIWLDMYLRYDYLRAEEPVLTAWQIELQEVYLIWGLFLPIGVTLLSGILHFREYQFNCWKQLLAAPVSRSGIYLAKWLYLIMLTCLANVLLAAGLWLVGLSIGFPEQFPLADFALYTGGLCVGALGAASLQHWLSSRIRSTVIPVAAGFCGSVTAIFMAQLEVGRYLPYASPLFAVPLPDNPQITVSWIGGLVGGALLLAAGMLDFRRKDIL